MTRLLEDRILAVLQAACVGDALGAATEGMTPRQILEVFGGPVTDYRDPPALAPFAKGWPAGRLTDDATQMLAMARACLAARGEPGPEAATAGIIEWARDGDVFARFAGPTTRLAVERLMAGAAPAEVADPGVYSCVFGASNGAAMRAPAAGCYHAGNPDKAARLATVLAAPTHNTDVAFAGAAAVAAVIAHGLGGGATGDTLQVALDGVATGRAEADAGGRQVGGPDIALRIRMAIEIGWDHAGAPDAAMAELEAVIGNGVAMAEAVPCAFGLAEAARYAPHAALLAGVNGGNDSDTIAMLAGSIAAAFTPFDGPTALIEAVEAKNQLDLRAMAARLASAQAPRSGLDRDA